jgi:hypothetical protein
LETRLETRLKKWAGTWNDSWEVPKKLRGIVENIHQAYE